MASRSLASAFRGRSMALRSSRVLVRGGGHGGGGMVPPMVPRTPPQEKLDENFDLIWDDGVAPETALDFDAPNVSNAQVAAWWAGGLGFFGLVALAVWLTNPEGQRPVVPREFPYNNLAVELGEAEPEMSD
eukprot:CAMPEP_0196769108 /NCGR_PEP_ID=MMETSP1104-20130614/337_1 /TAXON_ID=33652 /ORGANISM="Cafeteria sp., Strain Caron Lab Isolate" /LENGTH=130 /DNA_ID=CAMNT_0042139193 /DNA_START=10 /DNA_END=402 /DNA_ORIENTATION=+